MKQYDFETVVPRYKAGAPKWLQIRQYFPEEPEGIIPFSIADCEWVLAPEIRDGLKHYIDTYPLGYAKATPEYLQAVCGWMKRRHQWDIQKDWLVCTRGVVNAFYECVKAYAGEGEGVILFTPVYELMYDAIENNGRKLVDCPLINRKTHYEIDFPLFEKLAKDDNNKLLLFTNPHNPGGRVWRKEELEKICRICVENDIVIASDDIHFDSIMSGYHHIVVARISPEAAQRSVIMTAPNKCFNIGGLEPCNVIIPNPALREKLLRAMKTSFMDARCNLLGYEACRLAYTLGDEWLDQANAVIDKNRCLVMDFLKREFPEIICMDMEGSYLLWMDFSGLGIADGELMERLRREARLFFSAGSRFGEAGKGYVRWNLACPTSYVEEGLVRLKTAFGRSENN